MNVKYVSSSSVTPIFNICIIYEIIYNTVYNAHIMVIYALLLTETGGSTSASVDFTIGDENLNTGLLALLAGCT